MNNTEKYMAQVVKVSLCLVIVESILIFLLMGEEASHYFFGLVFGYFFNLIFFRLMYLNAKRVVEMQEKKAKRYMVFNYFMRYILTGFILFIAAKYPQMSLYTCFLGLLTIKLSVYIDHIIRQRKSGLKEEIKRKE